MPMFSDGSLILYLLLGSVIIGGGVFWRRHSRDLRAYLEPDLAHCGMRYVTSESPGLFRVGPFPILEHRSGRVQTHVSGIRGEYWLYRVVTFQNPQGNLHHVWALVEFEAFSFARVRWRVEVGSPVPEGLQSILEP